MPKMFYFGPWQQAGHYLVNEWGSGVYGERKGNFPWSEGQIDGRLQPHFPDCAKKRGYSYCGCGNGPEGIALIHHKSGWTALSFWDRSVDPRGACNSNFFAEGTFTFDEMVAMAKHRFEFRWKKMGFEVTAFEA
jgi:hypothetical protein